MMRSIGSLGVLLACLVGCGSEVEKDNEDQRSAWGLVRPTRYRFDYTVTGFAPGKGPWRVQVNGAEVVSVDYVGEGATPQPGLSVTSAPTVEDLFDRVERATDDDAMTVTVSYDSQWHHPAEANFDIGEEADGFKVADFTSLD